MLLSIGGIQLLKTSSLCKSTFENRPMSQAFAANRNAVVREVLRAKAGNFLWVFGIMSG